MKSLTCLMLAAIAGSSVSFSAYADSPLWMRFPAISPDGTTIAFTYKGDIYTVPSRGGRATQLTSNPAYDTKPVWSPDGKSIAFASDRFGNMDVFIVGKDGGVPTRLTTNTASEMPEAFLDNNHVLFKARIMSDRLDSQFPSGQFPEIYSVSTSGGRPEIYSSLAMEDLDFSPKGDKLLYHDMKGYEDPFRKHHQSSIARDIWLCELGPERKYTKLTDFRGEDRNPVWTADGSAFYYLSEQDGSFNVYKRGLHDPKAKKLTSHTTHPVRYLSSSDNGKLCYAFDGELYTLDEGGKPAKVNVEIVGDKTDTDNIHRSSSWGASDIAVSPNGKEVAFIHRGNVFVTSADYRTTKQVTNTPEQERDVDFSPDGRSIIYSSERNGVWGIYKSSLVRDDDKYFTYARELKEEPLIVSEKTSFQPKYSPDGKEVAFLEDRTTLRVKNLKSGKVRTVLPGKYKYSYTDGDQSFEWSPDGKWFLANYIANGGWNNQDIVLVKADGSGEMTNLTESGYSDGNAKWVLDGKAMIWQSDRAGYRSHGSWGAEADVYIMFFDGEAYDKFRLSKEELALNEEMEKARKEKEDKEKEKDKDKDKKKDKKEKKDKKDGEKADSAKTDESKLLKFDLANRKDRVVRLTGNSSHLGDAVLTPKGDKLYYCAAFEGGYDLWLHDLKEHSTQLLMKGVGGGALIPDKEVKNVYLTNGGIAKIDLGSKSRKDISFLAEFDWKPYAEREYIFDHTWRQVKDKFYDPKIHGIDWEGYGKAYRRFLPHISNNYDFRDLLSEMLGELNGSHTGARFYGTMASSATPSTAYLGAFYDPEYKGDGLRITEIINQGPFDRADSKVTAGCIVEKIDGEPIKAGEDYYPLLSGKAGKQVLLTVNNPATGERFEEQVKPISAGAQDNLLYRRWVESKRQMVDKLSGGKLGYIHIKGMDSPSFRETYSDLLGRYRDKDAVIIDTRHNGGGWLHEDLATLLTGEKFASFEPRGQFVGIDPFNRWTKPSCVLVCEDNYSNAHGFPWLYKTLKIGKLIGAPVPGTMTAVWWESQIDGSLVFGVPQVGMRDMEGRWLENLELQPDIEIYNTPESQLAGEDPQLVRAVQEMLKSSSAK